MLWVFLFFVFAVSADNVLHQIMRPNAAHTGLEIVPESLVLLGDEIFQNNKTIHLVSVVGPYHSGKSFLLNALIGKTNIFAVGPNTSPETMGLWLCRTNLTTESGAEIWFIDSEGFFGPQISDDYDAKIFAIALLLADELVYNTVKVIDAQAVQLLETLVRRAQLFERSNVDHLNQSMPHLTWVVEDFVQHVAADNVSYLTSYMETDYLSKVFPSLSVAALFLPATTRTDLADLSRVDYANLTVEFRSELEKMKAQILARLDTRPGQTLREVRRKINFLAKAMDRGGFPQLPSLWAAWQSQVVASSMDDAFRTFDQFWVQTEGTILSASEFDNRTVSSRNFAVAFFSQLVADFVQDLSGHVLSLDARLAERHQQAREAHAGAVQQHLSVQLETSIGEFLNQAHGVLVEPAVLVATMGKQLSENLKKFEDLVAQFEGSQIHMMFQGFLSAPFPQYPVHPAETLRRKMERHSEAVVAENKREISALIARAGEAGAKAIDPLLAKAAKTLYSPSEFDDWRNQIHNTAQSVFAATIGENTWMEKIDPDFEKALKRMNSEIDKKISKYSQDHASRLASWLEKNGEAALSIYRNAKRRIETSMLPCDEPVLADEHAKAVAALVHALDVELGGLKFAATEQYQSVRRELDEIVETEFEKLSKKNVELWKVHSDEATQCAFELNAKYTLDNCKQGWLCLFKLFPAYHRSKSRDHLLSCFDALARSMVRPPSQLMKDRIFDSWYEKELAKETSEVRSNMYIALVSALVPVLWIVYVRYS